MCAHVNPSLFSSLETLSGTIFARNVAAAFCFLAVRRGWCCVLQVIFEGRGVDSLGGRVKDGSRFFEPWRFLVLTEVSKTRTPQ